MWDWVRRHQHHVDIVVDLAYDWLPFSLRSYLEVPVAHPVSMSSINDALDDAVAWLVAARPGAATVHSNAQAGTFPGAAGLQVVVGNGIAVELSSTTALAERIDTWLDGVVAASSRPADLPITT